MLRISLKRGMGFTLIEIMIVIAIIAILAGIMVPNFMRTRAKAQFEACKQNMLTIAKAVELAKVRHSDKEMRYLASGRTDSWVNPNEMLDFLVDYGYLKKVPTCPSGSGYQIWMFGDSGLFNSGGTLTARDGVRCMKKHLYGDKSVYVMYYFGGGNSQAIGHYPGDVPAPGFVIMESFAGGFLPL